MTVELASLRVEASLDAQSYVAGANAKVGADQKMIAAGQQLVTAFEQTERKLGLSSTALERLARAIDPTHAASQKLEAGQRTLQRALDAGIITTTEHALRVQQLNDRYGKLTPAINDNSAAHAGLSAQAMAAFHALRSMTEQAAMGVPPVQLLAQHIGQLSFAASGPGGLTAALGGVGRVLVGFITPVTAAVTGIAALAAGFALIVNRALNAQEQLRQFGVTLRGMGVQGLATPADLQAQQRQLRSAGFSGADAASAIQDVVRAGLNPQLAAQISTTGRDLGAVLGGSGIQTLTSALSGGVESASKLGLQLHALTAEQVAAYTEMGRFGKSAQAIDQIFLAISAHLAGSYKRSLSDSAQAIQDLKAAWDDMLDAIMKSGPIQRAVELLERLFKGVSGFLKNGFTGEPVAEAAIPPDMDALVRAVIQVESGGDSRAVGPMTRFGWRAKGLMQLSPDVMRQYGVTDPFNGDQNVAAGTAYLRDLITKYGSIEKALDIYSGDRSGAYAATVLGIAQGGGAGPTTTRAGASSDQLFAADQLQALKKLNEESELQIGNNYKIAFGYTESAAAGQKAEAEAAALTETYRRLNTTTGELAKKFIEQRTGLELSTKQSAVLRQFGEENSQDRNTVQVLQLQASLQGQTTEEIGRQVALLKVKQQAEAAGLDISNEGFRSRLKEVDALGRANEKLAEATRTQQRMDDMFRSIGDTISSAIGNALDSIFDPSKAINWGNTMRQIVSSVFGSIAQSLVIRPLVGSALSAFGASPNVVQGFGTFGGGGSSLFGTLGNGASLLNSASSIGSGGGIFGNGGLFSGVGNFLNNFGASTGLFASPSIGGLSAAEMAGLGIPGVETGLLGGLTLTGALPFAGLALGAGFLLSSLFGNHKPRNQSAGGNIDFSTGRLFGSFSGGNSQIDQATAQSLQQISQFTQSILQASGGSLSGGVLLQNGVNTGFTADSTLPGYSGRFNLGKDAANAVNIVELALSRSLTGISDTMRQVINTVTDPSQLQSAIQFAGAYDKLKTAADNAFQSIAGDTQQIGPFAQALQQIQDLFKGLGDQATQFGLSLDPVNAALDEATKRLRDDFNRSIQDMITGITDPVHASVDAINKAGDSLVREAQAVGGDVVQVQRLTSLQLDQIWQQQAASLIQLRDSLTKGPLSGLTAAQQAFAANDNFQAELALVRSGNIGELGNLATAGNSVLQLYQAAYGNAPQTSAVRTSVLDAVNLALTSRGFASGGVTPPGWNLVGEKGPEWINVPGGTMVLPNGTSPGGDLAGEIRNLAGLLAGGNQIARQGLFELLRALQAQLAEMQRAPISEPPRRKVA